MLKCNKMLLLKNLANFIFCFIFLNSCSNPYSEYSNRSTDEARYEEALKAYNSGQWDTAIAKFQSLSPSFLNAREVRFNYAKALAGKCGYDFITFVETVSSTNFSGPTVFEAFLSMWGNRSIIPSFCTLAEAQVKIIWSQLNSTADRSISEKFFMALLSLAKMGMYLRVKADVDANGGLGNGLTDPGVDACTPASPPTQLLRFSDDEIKEVITGLALFIANLSAIGGAISNLSSLTGALGPICGPPLNASFCNKTNAQDVTSSEVTDFRKVLQSIEAGIVKSCSIMVCCP
jgi:hypothetical protein